MGEDILYIRSYRTSDWHEDRHKISITLEELGLQYNVHKLEFSKNQQKESWFLEINRRLQYPDLAVHSLLQPVTNKDLLTANGRIPAIVDKTSGKPKRVFEGASMQLYLCEKYDKDHKISFPYDSDEYWETVEWLVWMVSCSKSDFSHISLTQTSTNWPNTSLNTAKRHWTHAGASKPFQPLWVF